MLLGGHDEIVGLILVVDDVLKGDAELVVQSVEKILQRKNKFWIFYCFSIESPVYFPKVVCCSIKYMFPNMQCLIILGNADRS